MSSSFFRFKWFPFSLTRLNSIRNLRSHANTHIFWLCKCLLAIYHTPRMTANGLFDVNQKCFKCDDNTDKDQDFHLTNKRYNIRRKECANRAREKFQILCPHQNHIMGQQFTLAAILRCDLIWNEMRHILNNVCDVHCVLFLPLLFICFRQMI